MIAAAEILVLAVEVYLGVGLVFAIAFAWRGAPLLDPAARQATIGFRLLILPASALLWPLLLRRWARRSPPPLERTAHRDAAAAASGAGAASVRSPASARAGSPGGTP